MTYGIEWDKIPSQDEIQNAKQQLHNQFNIDRQKTVLLLTGR
jgi:hypothetical protein